MTETRNECPECGEPTLTLNCDVTQLRVVDAFKMKDGEPVVTEVGEILDLLQIPSGAYLYCGDPDCDYDAGYVKIQRWGGHADD